VRTGSRWGGQVDEPGDPAVPGDLVAHQPTEDRLALPADTGDQPWDRLVRGERAQETKPSTSRRGCTGTIQALAASPRTTERDDVGGRRWPVRSASAAGRLHPSRVQSLTWSQVRVAGKVQVRVTG
jgi:hypothetical protein